MMLLYKAWRESRVRFVLSAGALAWGCVLVVMFRAQFRGMADSPMTYTRFIWNAMYKGNSVRDVFVLLVFMLGPGGLLQEHAHGTAGFTLSLPVSRAQVVVARASVGIAEVLALACLPALILPVASAMAGEWYPWSHAWRFALLWSVCGTVLFATTFLLSTLMSGEYSAWVVAVVATIVYSALLHLIPMLARVPELNLFSVMSGTDMRWFREGDAVFVGAMPWRTLLVAGGLGAGLIAAAVRITKEQSFS